MSLIDYRQIAQIASQTIIGVGTPAMIQRTDPFTETEINIPVNVVLPTVNGSYKDGGSIKGETMAAFPASGPAPAAGDLLVVNGRKFRLQPARIAAPTADVPLVYKCNVEEVI